MARPIKIGLDYFPLNVDFFEDEKIEAISGEFGIKGELTTIKLLCAVYHNGYFVRWNDLFKMKLLKRLPNVSLELLEQIVNRLVKWGFFDETLFNSEKILTSQGIQIRYIEATSRRKEKIHLEYKVIKKQVNDNNNIVNDNNISISTDINNNINPQRKGNKRKERKREGEENTLPSSDFFILSHKSIPNDLYLLAYSLYPNIDKVKLQAFCDKYYSVRKSQSGYCFKSGKLVESVTADFKKWISKDIESEKVVNMPKTPAKKYDLTMQEDSW